MTTNLNLALLIILVIAAAFDLRDRRIPNWLTVSGFGLAILLNSLLGWSSLGNSLLGAAVGFTLGALLLASGGMGGGDAKLLIVVGAFLGPLGFAWALWYIALAGGVLALAVVIYRRAFRSALRGTGDLLVYGATLGNRGNNPARSHPGLSIPYAVPIAAGTIVAVWLGGIA